MHLPSISINEYNTLTKVHRQKANDQEQQARAGIRNIFFSEDNERITALLQNDLVKYLENADITRMKMITFDRFVKAYLKRTSQVHSQPPVISFGDKEDSKDAEKVMALLDEVDFYNSMATIELKTKLHNTLLSKISYVKDLDKFWIDTTCDASACIVYPHPEYVLHADIVAIKQVKGTDEFWIIWDQQREEIYRVDEERLNYDEKTHEILNPSNFINGTTTDKSAYFPFVTSRYQDHGTDFWQHGFDSLINMVRIFNILTTIAGDDTIQETIRLLILNFIPKGIEGEDGNAGNYKVGLRHPLYTDDSGLGTTPTADIVSADLYTEDIFMLLEKIMAIFSSQDGVPNFVKAELERDLSGVAIALKSAPQLRDWHADIQVYRKVDKHLVMKLIEANNAERSKNKIDKKIIESMKFDYADPTIIFDENAEYELERKKWKDGTSTPAKYLLRKNPELKTIENAELAIEENKKFNDDLFGVFGPGEEEEDDE